MARAQSRTAASAFSRGFESLRPAALCTVVLLLTALLEPLRALDVTAVARDDFSMVHFAINSGADSALISSGDSSSVQDTTGPQLPMLDWGACPFECCTYRNWIANAPTRILKFKHRRSPVAFELKRGDEVRGLTGVVVTTRAGRARVLRATELGHKRLKASPGDVVYILHYEGEGVWRFWFRGHIDSDQIPGPDDTASDAEMDLRISAQPRTTWWVKVRNNRGQVGWTEQTKHFDHTDACE